MKTFKNHIPFLFLFKIFIITGFIGTNLLYSQEISDTSFNKAKKLYEQLCAGCHGTEVRAFISPGWKYGTSDEEIYKSITEGRGNGAMPAFGNTLSDEEINELISYLQYGFENFQKYEFQEEKFSLEVFESKGMKFKLEEVAEGLEIPWGMAFLDDGSILVTEKTGNLIRIYSNGKSEEIKGIPEVISRGQGGLMDIELHPDYENNGWIYISFSKFIQQNGSPLATTAVSRFRLKGNKLVEEKLIFEALDYAYTRHHYGCRLEFDKDRYLYISMGDRGAREVNPQDIKRYPGKIHRLHDDGSVPGDNPFVNDEEAISSIFSYGHRNPQGLKLHPSTGEMWSHEHGPRGGDEINILKKGANYGWPVVSYGINYDGSVFTKITKKAGMEPPIHYWVPSIAPCGMEFITGDRYPAWKGHLMIGSLRFSYLDLCILDGNKVTSEEILLKNIGRLRNVKQGPDGYIYIAVEGPGRIYKIVPVE